MLADGTPESVSPRAPDSQPPQALEFDALRELVGRYVRSPLGRAALESIQPSNDRGAIEVALADAGEGMAYVRATTQAQPAVRGSAIKLNIGGLTDPAPAIARLRIEGAMLEAREIAEVSRLLDVVAESRSILLSARERFPRLAAHAEEMVDLRELAHELGGKILADSTLADHASVALGRLRRDIERQRQAIQHSLEKFLRAHHEDGTLQEDFVTIRNDRFVVPVVTGRERRVDGVIHGASGSGHTLFVEPLETIGLNNELVRLSEEEAREVHRILREFTARLREHVTRIVASTEALARLDLTFAKAEFALDYGCSIPRISPEGQRRLLLREARHPLLEDILRKHKKSVVPVSFELNEQKRTLLISGPNTGGKTVALKTAGLLTLMAHAGLPVPASEAEFPLLDEVLADIGDHQSIQESLSTFSAHIAAIRHMLEHAAAASLVLIDELGRATDPEEGGALGVAVLDAIQRRGAFTIASTHLMALKVYGASTQGAENGSPENGPLQNGSIQNGAMGFDEATLEPTYVLQLGAPGKSAGLDIASRLGLGHELIEDARSRLSGSERDISNFLSAMHRRLMELENERRTLAERDSAVAAREKSLEENWEKKYAAKIREIERQAAELSAQFEQRARETIADLSQKARAKIAKTSREFQDSVAAVVPVPHTALSNAPAVSSSRLEEGARVRLKGIRQPATIRRLLANGLIEVDAGFLKMQVSAADVEEILPGASAQPAARRDVSFRQGPAFAIPYREINLIGQRAEEACGAVDKFLDSAALAQVERIRIVHGHGMGILKRAVAELLTKHPHVEKFYAAPQEQGGAGATIVELKAHT
ncbi:MAG TPA: Smr/MutS family protein [Bryobacteraceae bacterium]|nr:Smr/MutS family protein [Bryobacteraceae bacterium]